VTANHHVCEGTHTEEPTSGDAETPERPPNGRAETADAADRGVGEITVDAEAGNGKTVAGRWKMMKLPMEKLH